jgi:tRNA-dihydrouridine synthase
VLCPIKLSWICGKNFIFVHFFSAGVSVIIVQEALLTDMNSFWHKLKKPVIALGPMYGVTDAPMRQMQVCIAKPDVLFTEFISAEHYMRMPLKYDRALSFCENERPIVAQVYGHMPQAFEKAVEMVASLGFDGIDINMGCPSRKILVRGGGGALIGNFALSREILERSMDAVARSKRDIPLSVKTRICADEKSTEDWFSFLSGFPLAAITVHGRPLSQELSGPVNWDMVALAGKIVTAKGTLCLGHGAVTSLSEAHERCGACSLDGIMICRGAIGNPWMFLGDHTADKGEIFAAILKHGNMSWEFYGDRGFLSVLKHFKRYAKGFDGCRELRAGLLGSRNMEDVKKILSEHSAGEK